MKVLTVDGSVINLDSFEKVECRPDILTDSAHVRAYKHMTHGGLLGGTSVVSEDIAFVRNVSTGRKLVADLTTAWLNDNKSFNVRNWLMSNDKAWLGIED